MRILTASFAIVLFAQFTACGNDDDDSANSMTEDSGAGGSMSNGGSGGDDGAALDASFPDPHAIPEDAGDGDLKCAELGKHCHPFDKGMGDLGDQCHEVGHEGDPVACAEIYDECMALCALATDAGLDAGHTHAPDAGHVDSGTPDGGHAGQNACDEIGHICHDLDTGPDAGLAHQCHDVGHTGDLAECSAIYDDCVALCGDSHH